MYNVVEFGVINAYSAALNVTIFDTGDLDELTGVIFDIGFPE